MHRIKEGELAELINTFALRFVVQEPVTGRAERLKAGPKYEFTVHCDTRSIASAATNASIDSLCYKEFNSPTIFAALLDEEQGGRFQIETPL